MTNCTELRISNGSESFQNFPYSDSNCSDLVPPSDSNDPTVPEPPLYILICVSIFYIFIFVLGVIGNCLVVIVIWRNADMRTTTNYFLVNLSIADLLVLVVCMPPSFVDLFTKEVWVFGAAMCKYQYQYQCQERLNSAPKCWYSRRSSFWPHLHVPDEFWRLISEQQVRTPRPPKAKTTESKTEATEVLLVLNVLANNPRMSFFFFVSCRV